MKLYHGSNVIIDHPDLSRSKPYKDFGRGFYLSAVYEQAIARAKQVADLMQEGNPCVSIFEWDKTASESDGLSIKVFDDYSSEWAEFVLANRDRRREHPVHDYDIVVGPIADDSVTYQLRRYTEGDISMERLIEELKYAKGLTIQYYFGTEKSLTYLRKI